MARIFLKDENYSLVSANAQVLGSTGIETLSLANSALNTTLNSNIDALVFSGKLADYQLKVQGTQLLVYLGSNLLATAGIQTDTDGTSLTFSDVSTAVTLTGLNQAKLGKATLGIQPQTYTSSEVTGVSSLAIAAQAQSKSITSIDTAAQLSSNSIIVQSLDSSYTWNKTALTYSYNTSIPVDYYGVNVSGSTASGNLTTGWQTPTQLVKEATTDIMTSINSLTNVSITQVASGGDIRFNMVPTSSSAAAFAYFPGSSGISGDVFINTAIDTSSLSSGQYGYFTIAHELGHSLGLKHPFAESYDSLGDVNLPSSQDNRVNTIMSYTDFKQLVPTFYSTKSTGSVSAEYNQVFSDSFMVYDIAVLQSIYGTNSNTKTGNDIYTFGTDPFYTSIWDAGGTDTLDFSLTTHGNSIKLTSGSYSDINYRSVTTQISEQQAKYRADLGTNYHDAWVASAYNTYSNEIYTGENALGIAYGAVIENAIGGSAADSFYDNSVDNVLWGGAGDDWFYLGAGGYDTLHGEEGYDTLMLSSMNKNDVQLQKQTTGETLLLANNFAASLIGIESIRFADQIVTV